MRRLIVIAAALAVALPVASAGARPAVTLTGAGATFPFPLISQWIPKYDSLTGVNISYNPIGSGGGIAAIQNRTVDFGASDAPLTADQFSNAIKDGSGVVQIPWALSATAVSYNLPGVRNNVHMTGAVLADIYLGRITRWNSARIKAINPGVNLPDMDIVPVRRSDGSGTSYNFTDYLSKVSPAWKSQVGRGTNVNWPSGTTGASGSSGVAGVVSRTTGAIGYFDIAYALRNKLQFFSMRNRSGKWALPGIRGIRSAASLVTKVPRSNEMHIVDPPAKQKYANAYPICTFTYVLIPKRTAKAADLKRFVRWALRDGQKLGPPLLFVPIPRVVLQASERTLAQVQQSS
jgi:phosphate transport system substrate-binding protein